MRTVEGGWTTGGSHDCSRALEAERPSTWAASSAAAATCRYLAHAQSDSACDQAIEFLEKKSFTEI